MWNSEMFLKLIVIYWNLFRIDGRTVTNDNKGLHHFMDESELKYYFGTDEFDLLPEYDIFDVPSMIWSKKKISDSEDTLRSEEDESIKFSAFESSFHIKLTPNDNLVSPDLLVIEKTDNGDRTLPNQQSSCHFLHSAGDITAAISNCEQDQMHGVVILLNSTFEILPLTSRLKSLLDMQQNLSNSSSPAEFVPHFIRRSSISNSDFTNDFIFNKNIHEKRNVKVPQMFNEANVIGVHRKDYTPTQKLTVEVGVFFDEAAYKIFAPFFNYDSKRLQDMLLAYMNGVQALYHHPSIEYPIDIIIVYMEIMKTQPSLMYHYNGERGALLDSFCTYQESLNPLSEMHVNHWDMGLYISGLNFYAIEKGKKNDGTMGLATVGGVCVRGYDCLIAEFGPNNVFGKPFPSSGFNSIYILTHEIGHNLGMHHDSSGNMCPKDGYIMSPSRGTQGETSWSTCSAEVLSTINDWASCLTDGNENEVDEKYDAEKYNEYPGQVWTAKSQCEVMLRDKDAFVTQSSGEESMCQNLLCRTPHRSGYYFAGPALQGSDCGKGKWCQEGSCKSKTQLAKPTVSPTVGWSTWTSDVCKSGCIAKSKGYRTKKRKCKNTFNKGCDGVSYEVTLCDDAQICLRNKRKTVTQYASLRCKDFSEKLDVLDEKGFGLQAPHENLRLWMGCAVFCKRKDVNSYYTPRLELNDLGIDAYFPDGTWCHREDSQNYYCAQHHCLPENFKTNKFALWELSDDVPLPQNAFPIGSEAHLNENLIRYLSVDEYGKPLLTELGSDERAYPIEGDWTDLDYRELPDMVKKRLNRI